MITKFFTVSRPSISVTYSPNPFLNAIFVLPHSFSLNMDLAQKLSMVTELSWLRRHHCGKVYPRTFMEPQRFHVSRESWKWTDFHFMDIIFSACLCCLCHVSFFIVCILRSQRRSYLFFQFCLLFISIVGLIYSGSRDAFVFFCILFCIIWMFVMQGFY